MDLSLVSLYLDFLTSLAIVYKIPPLKANVGHRAGEWGDLAEPLWKGRLRIIERSTGATMQFEDLQTGASLDRTPASSVFYSPMTTPYLPRHQENVGFVKIGINIFW